MVRVLEIPRELLTIFGWTIKLQHSKADAQVAPFKERSTSSRAASL